MKNPFKFFFHSPQIFNGNPFNFYSKKMNPEILPQIYRRNPLENSAFKLTKEIPENLKIEIVFNFIREILLKISCLQFCMKNPFKTESDQKKSLPKN